MPLTTHTVTLDTRMLPGDGFVEGAWTVSIAGDTTRLVYEDSHIAFSGRQRRATRGGLATFELPATGQAGLRPGYAQWQLSFNGEDGTSFGPYVFNLTGDTNLHNIITGEPPVEGVEATVGSASLTLSATGRVGSPAPGISGTAHLALSAAGTASSPTPAAPSTTAFGFWAGNVGVTGTRASYDKVKSYLGTPAVYRMFFGGLPPTNFVGSNADFGPPVVVSFKGSPTEIAAGVHDTRLRSWFNSIPATRKVWWSYWHEPEDDILGNPSKNLPPSFTAAQYRAAWTKLLTLAPKRATLIPTVILMRFSLSQANRPIPQYLVPGVEVLGWDAYLSGNTDTVANTFDPARAKSLELGLRFGVGECSTPTGFNLPGRTHPQTVTDLVNGALDLDADFFCWFETNKSGSTAPGESDWRMSPYPTAVAAWVAGT